MLHIIFNNISVDLGDTVWFALLRDKLVKVINTGDADYISQLEPYKAEFEKDLASVLETLKSKE